eukprot:COSAG01_NODE_490_length_16356_cov_34.781898_9_plen_172_part_00
MALPVLRSIEARLDRPSSLSCKARPTIDQPPYRSISIFTPSKLISTTNDRPAYISIFTATRAKDSSNSSHRRRSQLPSSPKIVYQKFFKTECAGQRQKSRGDLQFRRSKDLENVLDDLVSPCSRRTVVVTAVQPYGSSCSCTSTVVRARTVCGGSDGGGGDCSSCLTRQQQ